VAVATPALGRLPDEHESHERKQRLELLLLLAFAALVARRPREARRDGRSEQPYYMLRLANMRHMNRFRQLCYLC
jgi:hypothetical protein